VILLNTLNLREAAVKGCEALWPEEPGEQTAPQDSDCL